MSTPPHQPSFETARLLLRPRLLSDTDDCLAMDQDPAVTRFVTGPWSNPAAHRALIETRTLGPWPPGMGYWTIRLREDAATFVGWLLLIPADAVGPEIEIGWRLRRQFWGSGFATEAAQALLVHAFDALRASEVVADIAPGNVGSRRVAEKIGLKRKGTVFCAGAPAIRYSLTSAKTLGIS
jgi:RimJ/RimL family protein N-acetyltransferase